MCNQETLEGIENNSHRIQHVSLKCHSGCCVENGRREAKWNKETKYKAGGRVLVKMRVAWMREAEMEMERNARIQGIFQKSISRRY